MFYLARDFASTSFAAMTSPRGISRFSETPRGCARTRLRGERRGTSPLDESSEFYAQTHTRAHKRIPRAKETLSKRRGEYKSFLLRHRESVSFCDRILLSVFFARSRAQISRIFSSRRGGKNSKIGEIFSSFRIRTRERAFVPSSRENNDYDGSVSWRCFLCLDNPR